MWHTLNDRFKVLDIVVDGVVSAAGQSQFDSDLLACLVPRDKLIKNYTPESMDLSNHIMFSALYDLENRFVACSGIYRRKKWPAGCYRFLNRTYYSPAFRSQNGFNFFGADYILPHQLLKTQTPIDFGFVSREGIHAGLFLNKLAERTVFKDYRVSNEYTQVVPDVFDQRSFQKILYLNTTTKKFEFLSCSNLGQVDAFNCKKVWL